MDTMKKVLATILLTAVIPTGTICVSAEETTPGFSRKVLLSDMPDYSYIETKEEHQKFGFLDFYYGEPFDEIQSQYKMENEWGDRWAVRDMDMKGFLGFTKTGYVTFLFQDKKLMGIDIFVRGDKRNIALNLIQVYGTPIIQNRDPGRMVYYVWKKDKIAVVYQHDDNEKDVLLQLYPADSVTGAYK